MASEGADDSSKTEDPSQKRIEDARKRGDVAKSPEVVAWLMLGGTGAVLALLGPWTSSALYNELGDILSNADRYDVGGPGFDSFARSLVYQVLGVALLPLAVLALIAVIANLLQHRPLFSFNPIVPRLSKISPLSGAKRLFSLEGVVNVVKGVIKIAVVGGVIAYAIWPERNRLDAMVTADPGTLLVIAQQLSLKVFWAAVAAMTLIAVADYAYQRNHWWNQHRMTLQEVRDEFKQSEGDPKIKARIRQIRIQRARKRMMAAVPKATVIVTNPTHYAVALKYDRTMAAPLCVAKGVDDLALRIRKLGEEHDVPVVENPPLARALYASVKLDDVIPAEHFKAVAQVIGYVMRLKPRRRWRA